MNEKSKPTLSGWHAIINPILMAGLFFFAKNEFDDIKRQISMIPGLQQTQAIQSLRIDLNTSAINDLQKDFKEHIKLYGQKEEEIEFPKPVKRK